MIPILGNSDRSCDILCILGRKKSFGERKAATETLFQYLIIYTHFNKPIRINKIWLVYYKRCYKDISSLTLWGLNCSLMLLIIKPEISSEISQTHWNTSTKVYLWAQYETKYLEFISSDTCDLIFFGKVGRSVDKVKAMNKSKKRG